MKSGWVSIALIVAAFTGHVQAVPLVSGEVSFDSSTQLYTYRYSIGGSPEAVPPIIEFAIRIGDQAWTSSAKPDSFTEPPGGWGFSSATQGNNPAIGIGPSAFWAWLNIPPEDPTGPYGGEPTGGFSFTTSRQPATTELTNYFLFGSTMAGPPGAEGFFEYGHVVAPDFGAFPTPPPAIPEPETWLMLSFGLGLLALWRRRRMGGGPVVIA